MANISKIAGKAFIKVNGAQHALRGSVTANLKSTQKEGVAGLDGVHGYKETPVIPFIELQLSHLPALDLDELAKVDDATVQLECANGWNGVLRNAWANPGDVNPEEGSLTVRFEGRSGEWMKNA